MIEVRRLCKSYGGRPVLRDVSFALPAGVTCLMGPSGVGKTTLARILLGLERPDSGSVTGAEGLRFAAVFQEDRLLPRCTAAGNLRFALGADYDGAAAGRLLAELGLDGSAHTPAEELSGGMKRRAALARALLCPADALVLDEPFTGLDGENRKRCLAALNRCAQGRPVLLITHEAGDAQALSAAVVRL